MKNKDIKKKGEKCKVCNSDIVYGLHTTNESFVGDWEKEFDKKFIPDKITWSLEEDKQIKSFIKSALKEQIEEIKKNFCCDEDCVWTGKKIMEILKEDKI